MLKKILKELPLLVVCVLIGLKLWAVDEYFEKPQIVDSHVRKGPLSYVHEVHGRYSTDNQLIREEGKNYPLVCGLRYYGKPCPMFWGQHNAVVQVLFNEVTVGAERFNIVDEVRSASTGKVMYKNTKISEKDSPLAMTMGLPLGLYIFAFIRSLIEVWRRRTKPN